MVRHLLLVVAAVAVVSAGLTATAHLRTASFSETEAGFGDGNGLRVAGPMLSERNRYAGLSEWVRPTGPVKVALQAGHWKSNAVPEELDGLRGHGAKWNGHHEREVTLAIAERAAEMLRAEGVTVDVLPATVPPGYYADAFVAIHADDNPDAAVSGYKVASPWYDLTGTAGDLADMLGETYAERTGMVRDPNVTRDMREYYAFNWEKYDHALHPMTPAAIIETGYLTNAGDRKFLFDDQDVPARAITDAVLRFLQEHGPRAGDAAR